jgi:hypothetical protein
VVRRFSSDETPKRAGANQYFDDDWLQPLTALPARAGHNRFAWNLRTPRPRALDYDYSIAAVPGADTPEVPQGLFIQPGKYEVRLTVAGRASSQPLTVAMDPRIQTPAADLAAQRDFYDAVAKALEEATETQERILAVAERLKGLDSEAAKRSAAEVERFRSGPPRDGIAAAAGVLSALATDVEGCDCAPTAPQREVLDLYGKRLEALFKQWQAIEDGPLRELDQKVRGAGVAPVVP